MSMEIADFEPPVSMHEMGLDFSPSKILQMGQGTALYQLGDDAQLDVRFYEKRVAIPFKSKDGITHYEAEDWVTIKRPGANSWPERKARDADKRRFAQHWMQYKAGKQQNQGTRIETLQEQGLITSSQLEMLKHSNVNFIEQLVACSENVVAAFGPDGKTIQDMGKGFLNHLAQIKGDSNLLALKKQLEERNLELERKIQELSKKQEEMLSMSKAKELPKTTAEMEESSDALSDVLKRKKKQSVEPEMLLTEKPF